MQQATKEDFNQIYALMTDAFLTNEYRSYDQALDVFNQDYYQMWIVKKDDELLALMALWFLPEYTFLEHFAVKSAYRGQGIGSMCLTSLQEKVPLPLILEVEPVEDTITQKRVHFYKRHGFYYIDQPYIQPALGPNRQAIDLKLMSYPYAFNSKDFKRIVKSLHQDVYKQTAQS